MRLGRIVSGLKERGLRTRWAQQENRRNGKAYEAAQAAWTDTNAELQGMVVTACSYTGMGGGQLAPEVGLRRDETLLWTGAGVTLVETTTWPVLRRPGYQALSADLLTESFSAEPSAQLKPVDSGSVAVTDQRLVFVGTSPRNRRREWVFADLLGLAHTPDAPCTLLQANGDLAGRDDVDPPRHRPLTGLLLTPEAVSEFRFVVSLALAEGAGERAAFVAYLERMLDTHQQTRPAPPPLVTAKDAPSGVRLGLRTAKRIAVGGSGGSVGGRSVRLVAAVGAAFVLFNVVTPDVPEGKVLSAPPPRDATPSPSASVTLPAPDRILTRPSPAPTTPQPGSQPTAKGRPVPPPPEPKETRESVPTPTEKPKSSSRPRSPKSSEQNPFPRRDDQDDDGRSDWLCGAPWNPYQYNFCGGEYVYSPESGVCQYFACADDFWNEQGYLVECSDGKVTRTGGYRYSCSGHGDYRHTVYQFYSSWSGWREGAHGPDSWGPPAMDSDRDQRQH